MTLDELASIIEAEGLQGFASFRPELEAYKIYLVPDGDGWSVYATDERANVDGSARAFNSLEAAAENFLDRLRAAKRIDDRRRLGGS